MVKSEIAIICLTAIAIALILKSEIDKSLLYAIITGICGLGGVMVGYGVGLRVSKKEG